MATDTKSSSLASSSISQQQMNIYLKTIKTVGFRVKKSDTISDLKALYREKEGISEHLQEVFFSGEKLSDEQNLTDCGIQENSIVNLYVESSGLLKLFITIMSKKKTVEIEAKFKETIGTLKSKICLKEGINLSNQFSLYIEGDQLDDSRTLASIGIKGDSILYLISNPRDSLSVTVEFLQAGLILKGEAKLLFTVADLKAFLGSFCPHCFEKETLFHGGIELEDSKTLAYYELKDDSLLTLEPYKFQVFVTLLDGKTTSVKVRRSDTVSSLKEEIYRELRSFPKEYHGLTFDGVHLEDNRELRSYGIRLLSTLQMV